MYQYVNLNIQEQIILNQPVQNVNIVIKPYVGQPRNKKLLVYNSQKYTKYRNQKERAHERNQEESEEYSDNDFEQPK